MGQYKSMKCLLGGVLLLLASCKSKDSQYRSINSTTGQPRARLAHTTHDAAAPEQTTEQAILRDRQKIENDPLLKFLQSRGATITDLGYGRYAIRNNARARHGLKKWMLVQKKHMEVIAGNIANHNTNLDQQGNYAPYRRKKIVITTQGEATVVIDKTAPLPVTYDPAHFAADKNGMVQQSNVVVELELARAGRVAREYEIAAKLLAQFNGRVSESDKTLRTPSLDIREASATDPRDAELGP